MNRSPLLYLTRGVAGQMVGTASYSHEPRAQSDL